MPSSTPGTCTSTSTKPAVLPPFLLLGAILAYLVVTGGGLSDLAGPPVEQLAMERITLPAPGVIQVVLVNDGPEPVTVAQVAVDDAYWSFTIEPAATIWVSLVKMASYGPSRLVDAPPQPVAVFRARPRPGLLTGMPRAPLAVTGAGRGAGQAAYGPAVGGALGPALTRFGPEGDTGVLATRHEPPESAKLVGFHGALTPAETAIPLITFR